VKRKILLILILITALTVAGCGGGGGGGSSSPVTITPDTIKDVQVTKGSAQIIINAEGKVDSLVVIPYNTSLTAGNSTTTVTVSADSESLSTFPINAKSFSNSLRHKDFLPEIHNQEKQLLEAIRSKGNLSNLQKNIYSINNNFIDDTNTTRTFYKYYNDAWVSITATKKYGSSSTRCQIYLQNGVTKTYLSQAYINELGQAFDNFYDTEVAYFGSPVGGTTDGLGDIDNNDMIYILITDLEYDTSSWVAGYFYGVHEFPTSTYSYSNEKEMLFITTYKPPSRTEAQWIEIIKGTLAHEFQHLIYFNNRALKYQTSSQYDSETWINEGLSMVAEDLAIMGPGYIHNSALDDRVNDYLENSAADSLCTWGSEVADYAPAYMFMRYFVDRYSESSIKNILSSNYFGNNILTNVSGASSFNTLFRDWLAAVIFDRLNYSSDATFNQNYLYRTLDLSSYTTMGFKSTGSLSIPDTTGAFIYFDGLSSKNQITVTMSGSSNFGLRFIMIPTSGESFSVTYIEPSIKTK